jgi:hypothetical protein
MCSFEISLTTFRGLLILLFCLNNANLRVLSVHYQSIWAMQCDRGKKQMKNWHACLLIHSNTKHLYPHPHQCKRTHTYTHTLLPTHTHHLKVMIHYWDLPLEFYSPMFCSSNLFFRNY